MPELPDVTVYLEALRARILGARLAGLRLANPFVLRSVDPPPAEVAGRAVIDLRRVGKRVVIALEEERFVVIHLMIAGRLHWKPAGARLPGKIGLAALDFSTGTLTLTEAGSKRRAALHGRSVQQELRDILDRAAAEPVHAVLPRRLELRTVTTGRAKAFDRSTFYGEDER